MKTILLVLFMASLAAADDVVVTVVTANSPLAQRQAIIRQQQAANAVDLLQLDARAARASVIKSAIARLKVSAATNADIADILTLLKAINAELSQ